jgi:LacI family transcriptional regulator
VSISTVSRFLNSPEKVSTETARRIRSSIDQLDYFPYGHTGMRAHRSIGRIGVLSPFFPAPSFVQRLQGMTGVFRQARCEMVVCAVDSLEQLAEYLHSMSFLSRFDGLIIMSMQVGEADARRLIQSNLHVVMIESVNPRFTCVEADNMLGGRLAVLGFDNIDVAGFMDLSTVSQSLEESGRVAAQLLIDRIHEPDRPLQRVHLDVRVIERDTT